MYRPTLSSENCGARQIAGTRSGPFEQFVYLGAEFVKGREKRHGIEIALNGGTVADVHPRLVDIDAPVDTHDVAPGGMEFAEEAGRARSEVDHRHARRANA